jgi:hypothetical protein
MGIRNSKIVSNIINTNLIKKLQTISKQMPMEDKITHVVPLNIANELNLKK